MDTITASTERAPIPYPGPGAHFDAWRRAFALVRKRFGASPTPGLPAAAPAQGTEIAARLDEASRTWSTHLATAQQQMRAATEQLLGGFAQILEQLDAITDPRQAQGGAELDQRAAVLEQCETQLRGLLGNFRGFVRSRDEVMQSVRSLEGASSNLRGMAEDVAKLARQTNLLSINAAIEAARAGQSGRGFAVVAAEVRRLSTESGDTGKRIGEQVDDFGLRMSAALQQATQHTRNDTQVMQASEQTINQVVEQVDSAVGQLNQRATELRARGEAVRGQVEQLMIAFQFQDRVHQIVSQVVDSMAVATARLQASLASGTVPGAAEWATLLSEGYTTDEQRAVAAGHTPASPSPALQSGSDTTFF